MRASRLRMPDGRVSWTVLDNEGVEVRHLRDWIVHLEATGTSPNTIRAYVRYAARWCAFLLGNGTSLSTPTINDWDRFVQWYAAGLDAEEFPDPKVAFLPRKRIRLSHDIQNQAHMALKSVYRYLTSRDDLEIATADKNKAYDGHRTYKAFLDHINARQIVRKKDKYLQGNIGKAAKSAAEKRLTPEQVLKVIEACHLARDAFLVVLLYNSGFRIGEALGLRHVDFDLAEGVIWVMPRADNENQARTKGSKIRAVPMHDYVMGMYEDLMTSAEYASAFESGTEYVFCNVVKGRIGRALSLNYAKKLRELLIQRTRIDFHWHHFRHTHVSEAIAQGYSLLDVAERVGHASPQTTAEVYRHLFSSEMRKLHLTGPERVQRRLESITEAQLIGRDPKWLI